MPPLLMKFSSLAGCFLLTAMTGLSAPGQTPPQHFAQDGLFFDYPANWVLTDRSTPQAQHLMITRPGTALLIMIIAHRDAILSRSQLMTATEQITEPYIQSLVEKFGSAKSPAKRDSSCVTIGDATIGGVQTLGEINGSAAKAEVYAFPRGRRFVNLVYIRKDAEEPEGAGVWKMVRDSLKVNNIEPDKAADPEIDLDQGGIYAGGVMNGKAISLPTPEYPVSARAAHVSGTVVVVVLINETGNVISAQAVSGAESLRGAGEAAARKARFTATTLCGKPVKVNGSIIYKFVAR